MLLQSEKKMWSVLKNTKLSLYDFLIAAVTLSGLKKCKFILFHFWRPQVQNRSHVVKIKGQQHHVSFGGSRGHFASLPLLASTGCLPPLAYGHFFCFQSQQNHIVKSLLLSLFLPLHPQLLLLSLYSPSLSPIPLPPSCEDPCDDTGTICIMQDNLAISKSLI